MGTSRSAAAFAVALALLATSLCAGAQTRPDFLLGDWNVSSDYIDVDGSIEQTDAVATAVEETIAGTTTQHRLTLAVTRDGADVAVATTFALNPADGQWVMMQADSEAGTVDVASGAPNGTGDEWLFTSFPATRPDGGLEQFRFSAITADGFVLTISRSFDSGMAWEPAWTQAYTRAPNAVTMPPSPDATTCLQNTYGQFDFWLGEWELASPGGQSSGDRSRVTLSTGGCVVEETFLPVTGGGTSRSMYDARTGEWLRVWIEPGRMLIFVTGGIDGGDMIMTGGTTGSGRPENRTVWQPRADGSVRQFTQTSTDDGATWVDSGFDAIYVAAGSPAPPAPAPPPATGGGGGGSISWLDLLLASLLVRCRRIRSRPPRFGISGSSASRNCGSLPVQWSA